MRILKTVGKIVLFLAIVGVGIGGFLYLKSQKTDAERKPEASDSTIVQVTRAVPADQSVSIAAMGTVVPARSITLVPEVSGRIIGQNKRLVPGGRFKKGEVVARIDSRDYELLLSQQQSRVVQAEMELAMERGRKVVAQREWNLVDEDVRPTDEGKKLALREIQLETAEAAAKSAQSALDQARLNRSRTVIKAPFNALVTEEFVDVGQVVGPSTKLATLVDSDVFWVRVALPMDRLSWIQIPDRNGKGGSPVRVVQKVGPGEPVVRSGRVTNLLGDLDPKGKMARLLVEVEDPLGLKDEGETQSLPLLLGAYVSVEIQGPELDGMLSLPRAAVRENDRVWVKKDGKLDVRQVDVIWAEEDVVYLRNGITSKDDIVTTRIAAPIEGMALREEGEKLPDAGSAPPISDGNGTKTAKRIAGEESESSR